MSQRYWSKWGDEDGQTVGFGGVNYYVKSKNGTVVICPDELVDLVYKILEVQRKVEGE